MASAVDDATIPMEVDAAPDKPLTLRSRSGVSATASGGAATGKGRGRAGRRSAAGAGGAAGSAQTPTAPAPTAPLWSAEEHAAVVASLWRFGVASVSADQTAAASASNDGGSSAPVPSARAGSLRLLQAHSHTIASVSSKSAAQVSEYVRLLVWEACAAYLFAAPLLHAAGAPGHKLNGSFVRELIATHDMQPPNRTDAMTPQLATGTLYIPEHSAAAAADAPLVAAQAAPPAATEHTILSRWIGRLRRLMLLGEITRTHCAPDTPSIEADAAAADSSAAAAVASPSLAALAAALQQDAGLCYDATALDVLPRAQWIATDDAILLAHAVKSGYGALPPAVADLPAAMVAARLDFVLDEFHAACLARCNIAPAAPVAPVAAPSASPATASVPLPPSLTAPVWTAALVRQVVSVLTTHGLPVLSFAAATAAAAAAAPAIASESDKPSAASGSSDWVCPACPLLDWSALFVLLTRHTGQVFDERWQGALSALLVHLSADFEQCALSSDRATLAPDSATAAAANLLLPPASLQSFRRSLLFFHNLRVRILDPGFHGFADDNAVLEWVSQFAPGLPPPTPAQEAAVEAAAAASAASAPASVPTVSGSALTAMAARSDGSDFARISSNGGASLHCLSDSAAGLSVPGGSVIPDWWQIGFHDLCLLRSVHRWGVGLDEQFWQTVNRDIQRPAPSAATSATIGETASPAAASISGEPLSSLSWCDEGAWLAHSRPIILHRMSDPQPAVGPLPPPEPLQPRHRVALLRRISDLVASMSAIATDEFVNSLLSSVQAPAPVSETVEVKKETEGAAAADAATPAATTAAAAAPAPSASAAAAPTSPYPAVTLSQSASFSLRYFTWSLCGYSLQEDLWSLLKTRWHELVPSAQMQAMEGLRAAVLGTPAAAAAAAPSRKRRVGVHTSAAAARATMAAWGLIPADEVTGPENPLKLSDAAFLRPTPGSLSCVRGPGSAAASSTAGETGRAAFVALGGRNPATEQGCKRQRVDAEGVAMLDDEADDATASDQTMQGCESKLTAMLEAQQRQAELAARLRSLHGDAALPPTHALAAPFKVLVDRDARLVLPQRLGDGIVVHQLGVLSAQSLGVSQRAMADRAARAAMRAKRHSDGADSPAQPPAPQSLLLFPEGYVASVRHQSYVRVDSLAQYTCEIVAAPSDASGEAPLLFRLTASDDPSGRAIEGASAQAVWDEVCTRVLLLEEEAPLAQRQLLPCDGAQRFGLTCTAVAHALAVEIAADPALAQAVESAFGAAALQTHNAALPRCQFYLCDPTPAAAVAHQSAVNSALESEWSQQHLRLHRLALSVLAADRAEQVAVTSAQQQLEAQAAQAAQAAQVHAAAVQSTSSEAAVQAQAQAQAQLQAQAQQAAAVAQAQQQHLIRQRMEEEMAAAAAAAAAGVGMPMYGGAAAAPATQTQVASYSYVQPYAMQSAAPYGAYAVAMPTDAQQMYSAHHAAVQQQQQQQQQQAVHLAYMQQQQQQQQNNYNLQSMQ